MADLTQTLSNSLSVFGASPPNVWGTLVWGTDFWGASEELGVSVIKGIGSTVSIDTVISKDATRSISNSVVATANVSDLKLSLGDWDYIVTKPSSDYVDRILDASAKIDNQVTSWTATTNNSSDWSDI